MGGLKDKTYVEEFISAALSLRKIRSLIIKQPRGEFNLRPQSHVLIVSPFGTLKSSLIDDLSRTNPKEVCKITDFTKPAITGTINKQGNYVPSILANFAGKVMAVDEWNSIDEYGQKSLLSLLENQEITRGLGFMVNSPWKYNGKYGVIKVVKNMIHAKIHFSCIACAMTYPIPKGKLQRQTSKAILSRFLPVFVEVDDKELFKMISGHKYWNITDNSNDVDKVVIEEKAYQEYVCAYWDFVNEHNLLPDDPDDKGFTARVNSDIVRLSVSMNMPKGEKEFHIDDSNILISALDYTGVILRNYMQPFTKGKFQEFKRVYLNFPHKNLRWYSEQIGVTISMVRDYFKQINVNHKSEDQLKYSDIEKEIQNEFKLRKGKVSIAKLARTFDVSWAFARDCVKRIRQTTTG